MPHPGVPPAVTITGKKNSGKTTLVVALAAELKRRGWRIATLKHGHHDAELDQPGRDSWRHFHEGGAEAVILAAGGRVAVVMREEDGEPGPEELVERCYAGRGYDLVLVEGYKRGPFPKVEVFRRAIHDRPVYDPGDAEAAALFLAVVTDNPGFAAPFPVIPLDPGDPRGTHVPIVADLLEARFLRPGRDGDDA
jgi:molybdopterin-guanine dinucleotide biosynthesis protein B